MANQPQDSESAYRAPSMDDSIVDFANPPVAEVVCGIRFAELPNYSSPHMGLFWSTLRDEFPVAEVMNPLLLPGGKIKFKVSAPPPPRYFLRSEDRGELIQLQEDRFLYNWIRTESKPKYPRYRQVIKRFNKLRDRFESFLSDHDFGPISIRELYLAYVNHIAEGEGWNTPAEIGKVFPDFRFKLRGRRYLKAPIGWNLVTYYPVKDRNARLEVSMRTGEKKTVEGNEQRLFLLQLSVIGDVVAPSPGEQQDWFDMAREAIDLGFLDLTSGKMQNEVWRMHE